MNPNLLQMYGSSSFIFSMFIFPQHFSTLSSLQYNVQKSTVTSLHVFFIDRANQAK